MSLNINLLVMGGLILMLGSFAWTAWSRGPDAPEPNFLPFVPIDVRTTKVYVSKTRDASMYVESQRRKAILQNRPFRPSFKGSTNGYLEFGLTGIGLRPPEVKDVCPPDPESVIWSNGDADDPICDVVDAGGAFGVYDAVDFGGAAGNVCDA
jgi:hypothetical protein